jgi:bestrophin, other
MTVSYQFDIASSRTWSFVKVICRWRGSVWKSVFVELLLWLAIYYAIFGLYRFVMNTEQQK